MTSADNWTHDQPSPAPHPSTRLLTSVIADTNVTALYSCDDIQALSVCTAILDGETAGVTYWSNSLNGGISRSAVTLRFSQSPEFGILTRTS